MKFALLLSLLGRAGAQSPLPEFLNYTAQQAGFTCTTMRKYSAAEQRCCGLPPAGKVDACQEKCEQVHGCCGFEIGNPAALLEDPNNDIICQLLVDPAGTCECRLERHATQTKNTYWQRDAAVDVEASVPAFTPIRGAITHPNVRCSWLDGANDQLDDSLDDADECLSIYGVKPGFCGAFVEVDDFGAATCRYQLRSNLDEPCPVCSTTDPNQLGVRGISFKMPEPVDPRTRFVNYTGPLTGYCEVSAAQGYPFGSFLLKDGSPVEDCAAACDAWAGCCGFNIDYDMTSGMATSGMQCYGVPCDCVLTEETWDFGDTVKSYYNRTEPARGSNVWEMIESLARQGYSAQTWFVDALRKVKYDALLSGPGPFTVFIPAEDKLKEKFSQSKDTWLNHLRLASILDNHIVEAIVEPDDNLDGSKPLPYLSRNGEQVTVKDATLVLATNGRVAELGYGGYLEPTIHRYPGYTTIEKKNTYAHNFSYTSQLSMTKDDCAEECEHSQLCCGFQTEETTNGDLCQLVLTRGRTCDLPLEDTEVEGTWFFHRKDPVTDAHSISQSGYVVFGPGLNCAEGTGDRRDPMSIADCASVCDSAEACVGFEFEDYRQSSTGKGICTMRESVDCGLSIQDANTAFEERFRLWFHKHLAGTDGGLGTDTGVDGGLGTDTGVDGGLGTDTGLDGGLGTDTGVDGGSGTDTGVDGGLGTDTGSDGSTGGTGTGRCGKVPASLAEELKLVRCASR